MHTRALPAHTQNFSTPYQPDRQSRPVPSAHQEVRLDKTWLTKLVSVENESGCKNNSHLCVMFNELSPSTEFKIYSRQPNRGNQTWGNQKQSGNQVWDNQTSNNKKKTKQQSIMITYAHGIEYWLYRKRIVYQFVKWLGILGIILDIMSCNNLSVSYRNHIRLLPFRRIGLFYDINLP